MRRRTHATLRASKILAVIPEWLLRSACRIAVFPGSVRSRLRPAGV